MTSFDAFIARTIGVEGDGGGQARPGDRGGATRWGITEKTARAYGYRGDMSAMPRDFAIGVYREGWWELMRLDAIAALSQRIALELGDTGVNMGQAVAIRYLQRWLRQFNNDDTLKVDGLTGRMTLTALQAFLTRRGSEGEAVMVAALNSLQGAHYLDLAEADATQRVNIYGWMQARVLGGG